MLEMLINPRKAQREPWELFFVGLVYASLAVGIVQLFFSSNSVMKEASGMLIVTFTVMFSMPFIFYSLKLEENKIEESDRALSLLSKHKNTIYAFMWLFIGFLVAFSFWSMFISAPILNFQLKTYCQINGQGNFESCLAEHGLASSKTATGYVTGNERFMIIFFNNISVLVLTLLFSFIFGAGAIFVLAWNASVIAAAIGIFTRSDLSYLPIGLARYMIHGIPEIAAYFIVALAGGLVSVAVIKHEFGTEKFWEVLQDSLNLIILAVIVLLIGAVIEVYITPLLF